MEFLPLVPQQFLCPISLELMSDPVTLCTGITYDRLSIENWLSSGRKICPVTNQVLVSKDLVPNVVLQRLIHAWRSHNKWLLNGSKFADDSPPEPFGEALQDIEDGSRPVLQPLRRVHTLALENRGNTDTISSTRGLRVLSAVLSRLRNDTRKWNSDDTGIYREALGILCMLSLNDETKFALIHSTALPLAITFLDKADIQHKVNFVRLLGNLAREEHFRAGLCAIEGLLGRLFDLLGQDVNLVLVETILITLCELCMENCFRLTALNLRTISKLAVLLRSRKGTVCEKSFEFLELLLSFPEDYRAAANEGAFIVVPALTSSILEVSEAATDHAVRILYKLCSIDRSCRREAVRTGAVAKALILLQAHCTTATKRQSMKLLQILGQECNQVPYVYRQGRTTFPISRVESTAAQSNSYASIQ